MEAVTRKRYTAEFKAQAVELVGLGKPVSEVAEDLEIATNVFYRRVRNGGNLRCSVAQGRAVGEEPEADGLRRLRRENANLKLENDILNKAAVILGTKPQPFAER